MSTVEKKTPARVYGVGEIQPGSRAKRVRKVKARLKKAVKKHGRVSHKREDRETVSHVDRLKLHDSEACEWCKAGTHYRSPMDCYPDAHVLAPADVKWVQFTKRTEDPKLLWLEYELDAHGIPSRRSGSSFHAPILLIPEDREEAAWAILDPIDDVDDDDPRFNLPQHLKP